MLTKKQFTKRLQFIQDCEVFDERLNTALKEYAPSDFTGFSNSRLIEHLVDMLVEDMNDTDGFISWWLWDTPKHGTNPDGCKIWKGDLDNPEKIWVLNTPEKLYDYLLENQHPISKTSLRLLKKGQDNGIRYALNIVTDLRSTNSLTKNEGWEQRNAEMVYISSKITNSYLLETGAKELNSNSEFFIIKETEES